MQIAAVMKLKLYLENKITNTYSYNLPIKISTDYSAGQKFETPFIH